MKPLLYYLVAVCITLTSCVYSKKHVEGTFTGLSKKILHNDASTKDTRIMVVHGVGEKKETFADTFINKFIIELAGKKPRQFNNGKFPTDGNDVKIKLTEGGNIIVRKYKINDEIIRFYIVHWSDITHKYKEFLYKNEDELAVLHKPASLNRNCKRRIMLENLSDFVFYTGYLKEEIQEPIKKCMRLMFVDTVKISKFEMFQNNASELDNLYDKGSTNRDVYLFTWSLATKITLDVLSKNPQDRISYTCDEDICEFFYKNLRGIYMMSHQVPLLSNYYMGTKLPQGVTNENEQYQYQNYYGICNFLMNNNMSKPIDYVAFNDPNDFLGYKFINEKPICRCQTTDSPDCNETDAISKINKVVFSVRNTGQFLGWIANPDKAHTAAYNNSTLIKILCRGVNEEGEIPKPKDLK